MRVERGWNVAFHSFFIKNSHANKNLKFSLNPFLTFIKQKVTLNIIVWLSSSGDEDMRAPLQGSELSRP